MQSLARAARKTETQGVFLKPVFLPLEQEGIRLREGTVTMFAGPPGAYKTGFVLYWVLRLNLPTLFFSADGESFEMVERAAAAMSGDTVDQVRQDPERYVDLLAQAAPVRFVYEDSPTYLDLELEVAAFAEVHGRFPAVIVVDNLMNVTGVQENEWASTRDTARVLHRLTRITKAALLVLAHMSDDRTDPSKPAPRNKLLGKVSQLPKMILSLALNGDELLVAPVKSRWSRADASGQTYVTLYVDPARNRIYPSRWHMENGMPA